MIMSNKVEVVLLQSVKWLGNKDDIVSVAIPYAKNVLLAQWKAKLADKQALDAMKQKKDKAQKHDAEMKETFDTIGNRVAEWGSLKIQKKSTPAWHLYEKVSVKDIQEALNESAHVRVDTSWIAIAGKIEAIGETMIGITYKGKTIKVPVTVM